MSQLEREIEMITSQVEQELKKDAYTADEAYGSLWELYKTATGTELPTIARLYLSDTTVLVCEVAMDRIRELEIELKRAQEDLAFSSNCPRCGRNG
jgi:hypothetical protein